MAGISYVSWLWLVERLTYTVVANPHAPDLTRMMTTAGVIGLVLGFFIPTWFREAPRAHGEEQQLEPARNGITPALREGNLHVSVAPWTFDDRTPLNGSPRER